MNTLPVFEQASFRRLANVELIHSVRHFLKNPVSGEGLAIRNACPCVVFRQHDNQWTFVCLSRRQFRLIANTPSRFSQDQILPVTTDVVIDLWIITFSLAMHAADVR